MDKIDVSIVTPVYNNAPAIKELVTRVETVMNSDNLNYEIIFVDDGSIDDSWNQISEISQNNQNICGIQLSRNFGQHVAVKAGQDHCQGKTVVIMDCDLQDPPENFSKMYSKLQEGYDVVFTKRIKRQHGIMKTLLSEAYKRLFHLVSNREFNFDFGSQVLFTDKVNKSMIQLREQSQLYLQVLIWTGFKTTWVSVDHEKRTHGKSSYTFSKLLNLSIDGLLFNSDRPLKLVAFFGILISMLSLVAVGYIFFLFLSGASFRLGWPSLIVTILFSTGILMFSLGIMGLYIARIFAETKNRPHYIIRETCGTPEK